MNNATKTDLSAQQAERDRMIREFLTGMRRRDLSSQIHGMRLDLEILKLDLAVDEVFARHHFEVRA